jgi:4-hydroxybenzoate polyprenyltransferase
MTARDVLRRLRLTEPWRYKAPLLISVPYFLLAAGSASWAEALAGVLWALCTIVGIGGFAYLSNDVSDRQADLDAGRPNGTAGLSPARLALAFAAFLAAALAPWILYFPTDALSLGLLAAEFLLLLAYSVPPVRLKERGLPGLVADALYAQVVPALLAAHTFHALTRRSYEGFTAFAAMLGAWQLFFGLRSVLTHQLADAEHDRAAGTSTYVLRHGAQSSQRFLAFVLAPLELATWVGFTALAAATMPILAPAWPIYVAVTAVVIKVHHRQALATPLCDRLDRFLNEYYLRWMPLVILVGLCLRDGRMIALLLLHVAIFRNGLTPLLGAAGYALRRWWPGGGERRAGSARPAR